MTHAHFVAKGAFRGELQSTRTRFNRLLKYLNLSVYAAAPILGISLRQAQRYSSGEDRQEVSLPVAKLLIFLQKQIFDLKRGATSSSE